MKIGAVPALTSSLLPAGALERAIRESGARLVLTTADLAAPVAYLSEPRAWTASSLRKR